MDSLSFKQIVNGSANVRITPDHLIYAVDLTMVVTGQDRNNSARALRRISGKTFPSSKLIKKNISTSSGEYETSFVTFSDAIELVMVLPGKIAQEIRSRFVKIICQYMSNDPVLKDQIGSIEVFTNFFILLIII